MKKYNLLLKAFVAIVTMLSIGFSAFAYDFEAGGIYYNITDYLNKTVEVTFYDSATHNYDIGTSSYVYSGKISIPSSVTFNGVTFCVTEIGDEAFMWSPELTSITIPNSVIEIGNYAFHDCYNLHSVTIPNSVTETKNFAFSNCSSLTSITIPNSVTSIGNGAFWYCTGLISVSIGNSVTSIGDGTFRGCSVLTSVSIPNSVTSIGDDAFQECSGLAEVNIPNSVTSIGNHAFYDCSNLHSVTIPNSVTTIGYQVFNGCSGLNSIVVESSNSYYDSRNKCNAIIETSTNTLIEGCKNTTIPNSVTSIGSHAFTDCTSLTSISIPNSVTTIGDLAFYNCNELTSITIGNFVTTFGNLAFYNTGWYNEQPDGLLYLDYCCLGYKGYIPTGTLSLKDGTRVIGDKAFYGCSELTGVTIPNSVTFIGFLAFCDCNLKSVTSYCGTPPACRGIAFNGSYSAILKVPEGTKDAYANATEWKEFTNIQEIARVEDVEVDNNAVEVGRYDIHGHQLSEPTKGVNIIKMSDGSIRKELMK